MKFNLKIVSVDNILTIVHPEPELKWSLYYKLWWRTVDRGGDSLEQISWRIVEQMQAKIIEDIGELD